MVSFSRLTLAAACALSLATTAHAAGHATSQEAQGLLDKAAAELTAAGPDKAFAEFNAGQAPYKAHELYVFVFTMDGVYEASGANPKLVGTHAIDMTDAEGKLLVREMIQIAKTKGQGRVDYVWLNRADNHVEHKRSLVRRVGDHIVGVGYYAG
ncbi:cache domain-containing protein [Novosphingobium sp. Fuku2-ISO-50]|uniref:cache domain-containing protein n=1 Tax=Novosphingobium sp. Fuku2-ISO-50 TaxID=1739114 RepID=UPI00076CE288|nr:cache domain-containing protein [Novosphingobium sp. Fuku2-ISO-50]KUR81333.1 histidine kinase [Novosphingobium sp. Fuku2-ISO-50]